MNPGTSGKLAVVGSGAMFSDQYLDKEDNNKIKDVIFDFLTSDNFKLNEIDADDPEVSDYNMVPVGFSMFNRLKSEYFIEKEFLLRTLVDCLILFEFVCKNPMKCRLIILYAKSNICLHVKVKGVECPDLNILLFQCIPN